MKVSKLFGKLSLVRAAAAATGEAILKFLDAEIVEMLFFGGEIARAAGADMSRFFEESSSQIVA